MARNRTKVQKAIGIPEPTNKPDSLWRTTQALKEAVEVMQGIRGNREYALLCDLEDTNTLVNNVLGAGSGVDTFFDLTDTDLTGQVQYDLAFNADGTNWEVTGSNLHWVPNSYLQFGNGIGINWYDSNFNTAEFLVLEGSSAVVGEAMDYYNYTNLTASTATPVDSTYRKPEFGVDISQATMRDGEEYMVVHTALYNGGGNAPSPRYRLNVNGAAMPGSFQQYESNGAIGTTDFRGTPYDFCGYFTANTAGGNLFAEYYGGSASIYEKSCQTFVLNLTSDVPNHVKDANTTTTIFTGSVYSLSDCSVTLPAGNWMIFSYVQFAGFGATYVPDLGIDVDGTYYQIHTKTARSGDYASCGGSLFLEDYAGGTITISGQSPVNLQLYAKTLIALPMSDFADYYAVQSTVNSPTAISAARYVSETIQTISVPSIANTGAYFGFGWFVHNMRASGAIIGSEILTDVNSGGATLVGYNNNYEVIGEGLAPNPNYTGHWVFTDAAQVYTAGDSVDLTVDVANSTSQPENSEYNYAGAALIQLARATVTDEQFVVGDPVYKTRIDGTAICVANNIGVNWADSNAVEAEFLVLEGENGPGALLTDQYNQPSFVGPHNRVTTSTSWVDVTDFFIDTSGLTNGANYFFFINTTNANGSSNFPTTSETRLATDSGATEFIDSVAIYCQADNPGVGYNYQMVHPVDTSSNITLQHRDINGNSVESYYWTAWGLNTDNLAPNSFFHSVDEIGITISSSGFKSTAASVTVPAGDYLFFTTARHNPTGGSTEFLYTGISDGTTITQTHFFQNDATQDRIQSGGTWIEKNVAEGTTFTTTVACDQGRGSVSLAAITAIRLGGFKEYYAERNDTQVIFPQLTTPYPVDFEFVAQNSGVFAAVGFCKTKWPASGQSGLQQVPVNIDAGNLGSFGSDIQIARSISQSTDNPTTGEYTKAITPNNTFTVTAGDRVRVRCGRYLSANSADLEQYNGVAVAVFSLAASDILTEQFVAGDPGYTTVIEGTATNITSVATDIDGTLNVDGLATFQADVTISDDLTITSGAPKIFMQDSDATADEGNWIIANTTDSFRIETASDAAPETPINQAITIGRTGTAVATTNIEGSPVLINGLPINENATHTGEVTGSTALTLDVTAISNQTFVEADALDNAAIEDDTDGALKKTTLSSITDGGFF